MKKSTLFFKHSSNSRLDERLISLRMKFGWEGYGLYWAIIERLRECPECKCVKDYNMIAFDLQAETSMIKSIVEDFRLFVLTENSFYSDCLLDDVRAQEALSASRSAAGKKGMEKRYADRKAVTLIQQSNNTVITELQQSNSNKTSKVNYPFTAITDLWNSKCGSVMPEVKKLTEARKAKIKARLKEFGTQDLWMPTVEAIFDKVMASSFLRGETGWKATFDWVFENQKNWIKVLEGNYDDNDKNKRDDRGVQNAKKVAGGDDKSFTTEISRDYSKRF